MDYGRRKCNDAHDNEDILWSGRTWEKTFVAIAARRVRSRDKSWDGGCQNKLNEASKTAKSKLNTLFNEQSDTIPRLHATDGWAKD